MSETKLLGLPFIAAAQAQKHVTHNEALLVLDAVIALSVASRGLANPPVSPAEGDRYLVAASSSGEWTGQEGTIAARQDGVWHFYQPQRGWLMWVADEARLMLFDGAQWRAPISELQNAALAGINTTADATNKLAVRSNAALFTALYAADGGSGDVQAKLNKETTADTASFLFQTGFSGRAEVGSTGDDNFHVKVSADGSSWKEAIVIDKTTGAVQLGAGSFIAPSLQFNSSGIGFAQAGDGSARIITPNDLVIGHDRELGFVGGTAKLQMVVGPSDTSQSAIQSVRYGSSANSGVIWSLARSRAASIGSFGIVADGDRLFNISAQGDDGTAFMQAAALRAEVDGAPGVGAMPGRWIFLTSPNGSSIPNERLRIDNVGNLAMGGANIVIDANRHFRARSYTIATLPAASAAAGQIIYCSDLGGGGGLLESDGASWRRLQEQGGCATLAMDADFTLVPLSSAPQQFHTATLTANRAVTLSASNSYDGARFRIVRTGGGVYTLDVGPGSLKSLIQNSWADFIYDATAAAWKLAACGTL